jgi:hypothetical protein
VRYEDGGGWGCGEKDVNESGLILISKVHLTHCRKPFLQAAAKEEIGLRDVGI